ncbi:hypothetical protein A1O1_03101 [Capronia coronata CBS 617.96]|uniref:DUF6594 domain-containing protein n=1 Tax=Capronia coronata CBS 617.96 TaxID=1182541 RepID=W9ZJK9_9EURO|nr:uncharacterized protein A1O1_03101 [Capronia coronata CBS 617.96]EXJ94704.1 hypothetical protein A1O1_03101 [Capronia coronata CBS 617.96]
MFTSVRDQGRRRRSQTYGVSKGARSSKLSLLSAITTGSHGSNDSASTITQESYTKSSSSSGKKRRTSNQKRSRESRDGKLASGKGSIDKTKGEKSMSKDSIDVFAFLVQDDNQSTSTQQPQKAAHFGQAAPPGHEESDNESMGRSLHSDSGISMGDNSVGHPASELTLESHLPPLPEDRQEISDGQEQLASRPHHTRPPRWKWPDIPLATHQSNISEPRSRTPSPSQRRVRFSWPPKRADKGSRVPRERLSGYDLVADHLSRGALPPVFRQFGKIHFRVLLQIQDEIVEMEEELAALDLADGENRLSSDGSTSPASRRVNWQWGLSELQARRLEVLGRLYIKLEQYYQALISGQKVQKLSTLAMPADIEQFRAWLQEHNPLSTPEAKFLDDEDDLVSLREASAPPGHTEPPLDLIALCIVAMALFPLLCFKMITGVLNRLILLTALWAAGCHRLEKLHRVKVEQHQQWLVACFGVSLVAALFL